MGNTRRPGPAGKFCRLVPRYLKFNFGFLYILYPIWPFARGYSGGRTPLLIRKKSDLGTITGRQVHVIVASEKAKFTLTFEMQKFTGLGCADHRTRQATRAAPRPLIFKSRGQVAQGDKTTVSFPHFYPLWGHSLVERWQLLRR